MTDALKPTVTLLAKLGSALVHIEELISDDGHAFDHAALEALLADPEIKAWLSVMRALALVPEKRHD